MIIIGDRKELVMLLPKRNKNGKNSGYYTVFCAGAKRHYRKDGSCKHTQGVIQAAKPNYRKRISLVPFGGKA